MALTDKLSAIGDAIRAKTGGTDMLTLDQMPTAIAGIQTGSGSGGDYNIIVTNNSDGTQSFAITDASGSSGGSGFWDEDYARQIIEKTITSINFPSGLKRIGSYFMSGFDGITSISIPNGVTHIEDYAFYYCNKLVSISLPESIKSIGASAFYRCEKLESISLPNLLTIGDNTFAYCKALTSITIPASVNTINGAPFGFCTGLTSVNFKGTPTGKISASTFTHCTNLTNIYVPWAEGAVADAPWGATNATIHYNTTT